ncbi:hypothetical protein LWI29_007789 [Acer saccharum]|uniref:Uncharacterized protein n=1 Tax=Acer saccharum TaxID=4024 RepID=A0AA39RGM8_ACESA|nr:hypothetical protein LWI29_007789 [Acer saccharum]
MGRMGKSNPASIFRQFSLLCGQENTIKSLLKFVYTGWKEIMSILEFGNHVHGGRYHGTRIRAMCIIHGG